MTLLALFVLIGAAQGAGLEKACAKSDPCRTVDAYLRALKVMDAERLESFVDPAYKSRRPDGSEVPFDKERNRTYREFERGTKTRWTYSIIGIDNERITALTTEDNEFYQLLGVGVRTQVVIYAARNGRIYASENPATIDESGNYRTAYRAFADWLKQQPSAASDPDVIRDNDLVFSAASAPKLVSWLRQYQKTRKDPS